MSLIDAQIRNAKPRSKLYKWGGGGRMHLNVTPSGSKRWRRSYLFHGNEKLVVLGYILRLP